MTLPRTRPALWFEAMEEGKVAYFRKGKLVVEPRRPDPRTYAEAAAADDKTDTPEVESACERPADDVNSDCRDQGQREPRRQDRNSPRRGHTDSQPNSSRPARANRGGVPSGSQQPGLHDFWSNSSSRQSPKYPVNKTPSRNIPARRSERNRRQDRQGHSSELTFLVYNVENLCGQLNNSSFMNYVSTFDVACLTETFADSTFDFSGMFTKYQKKKKKILLQ